ncbi:MAG: hypothetical protein IPK00_05850 [Deltaproteobacteria bacterium]|nr:hypothetical protein [Deltaproteobacteria bacterium]
MSANHRLEIHPMPPRLEQGECILSAELHMPTGETRHLWFAVDADQAVTDSADPFLIAAQFLGMQGGWDIHVTGRVSALLIHNLRDFQAVWQVKDARRYRQVRLSADELLSGRSRAAGRIITFSGGVDSTFTALNHAPDSQSPYALDTGLMIHGFDIPLEDPAFQSAWQRARGTLASLGMDCLSMRTNFRAVVPDLWRHTHGTALAACLHVLSPRFGTALIPSSAAYHEAVDPCGSDPLTDPMLSSDALAVVHDGARFARRDKLAGLAGWPRGLEGLRVCWEGERRDRNCCRCEKCIRNMLNFRLLGMPIPSSFPEPLSAERIESLKIGAAEIAIWKRLIALGGKGALPEEILRAMRRTTRRMQWRRWRHRVKSIIRQVLRPNAGQKTKRSHV